MVNDSQCLKFHYGRVPKHTLGLHALDPKDDMELIKKIVNRHGGCNFPEYQQFSNEVVEVDEDMI